MAYSRDEPIEESTSRRSSVVLHTYSYFSSHMSPNGLLVHSGPKCAEGYHYVAPNGISYQTNWTYNDDGSPTGIIGHGVSGSVVNDKRIVVLTIIDSATHTYSLTRTEYSIDGLKELAPSTVGLASRPSEVLHAIRSGEVSQQFATTINGAPALALSIKPPRGMPDAQSVLITLYVDAHNHQPLRSVTVVDDLPSSVPYIADWMPATPDNIARARDDSIPAGYTKVDGPDKSRAVHDSTDDQADDDKHAA